MTALAVTEAVGPTSPVLRILVVEDSPSDALLVRALLQGAHLQTEVTEVATLAGAAAALTDGSDFDCVLLDLSLPDASGLDALTAIVGLDVHAVIVVLTENDDQRAGLAAVAAGAQDYLIKSDISAPTLVRSLNFAIERHRAAETSGRLAAVIDASPDAILTHHLDGTIETWSPGAEKMFGYTSAEAVGRGMSMLDPTEPDAFVSAFVQAAVGTHSTLETAAHTRTGTLIDISVHAAPIRIPGRRVTAVSTVTRDVTDRKRSDDQLRFQAHLLDSVGQAVVATDVAGTISYWNKAAEQIYGWTADEAQGRRTGDIVVAVETAEQTVSVRASLLAGQAWSGELLVRRRDGTTFPIFVTNTPILDKSGVVVGAIGVSSDISERRHTSEALARTVAQLSEAQRVARFGSWELEVATGKVSWSDEQYRLLGYEPGEVEPSFDALVERVAPADKAPARRMLATLFEQGVGVSLEVRLELPGRSEIWLAIRGERSAADDGAGLTVAGTSQDVTEAKRFERELQRLALHDGLTQLPNRALLADRLSSAQSRCAREGGLVGVLFIDLDHFKVVNDGRGHSAGDVILREVAERVAKQLRPTDTIARFGGDEFVVVLEGLPDETTVEQLADRIASCMLPPFIVDTAHLTLTASIGIAIGRGSETVDELLSAADAAMYRAKDAGRARHVTFDESMRERAERRLLLEGELRAAIEGRQFRLVYQPIVSLSEGSVVGVEALVRWDHPKRGVVSPAEFIPLAEEIGVIGPLGSWVLEESCRELAAQSDLDLMYLMSVNVSACQLADGDFPSYVARTIAAAGLTPDRFVFEITETVLMTDAQMFLSALDALRAIGVSLAMDDFGTGYSSLAYLQRFPLDIVKIDQTFVSGVATDAHDEALVSAIIAMATALGMATLAEGIETPEQLEKLRDLGCDLAQGYLMARPLNAPDLRQLLLSAPRW